MAHQIKESDRVYGTIATWHGLETIVEKITPETASPCFGEIQRVPMFAQLGDDFHPVTIDGKAMEVIAEKWQDLDGTEHLTMLAPAADTFQVQSMLDMYEILASAFADVPYEITCLGTYGNRSRAWISAKLIDKDQFIVGGETFGSNINLMDGRDKLARFILASSDIRVVCANTFGWASNEAMAIIERAGISKKAQASLIKDASGITGTAKHTKNFRENVDAIRCQIPLILQSKESFKKVYGGMQKEKITVEKLNTIIFGLLCKETEIDLTKGSVLSTRSINAANAIRDLAITGKGNMQDQNRKDPTVADIWNGITEYYTSGMGSGNPDRVDSFKKFVNSEFATGARIKRESLLDLSSDETLDQLATMGQKLLDNAVKLKVDLLVA